MVAIEKSLRLFVAMHASGPTHVHVRGDPTAPAREEGLTHVRGEARLLLFVEVHEEPLVHDREQRRQVEVILPVESARAAQDGGVE
jgi:hypothetical protein